MKFSQSGSRGKLLITFDQRGTIRFHKLRGLRTMQTYEYEEKAKDGGDIDYVFTSLIETTRIELKHESFR